MSDHYRGRISVEHKPLALIDWHAAVVVVVVVITLVIESAVLSV
jgi:hypothetical protein